MKAAVLPEISISAAEFKAKCLKLMDQANADQRVITVTKRGKPVGQFVPMQAERKSFRSIVGRSPGIVIPSPDEWKKVKSEWTKEWDDSTKNLAELVASPKPKKHNHP